MAKILITGASKGIGYETALTLARAGHTVVASMRNPGACDLGEVAGREKLVITLAPLDVDDDASVAALFASGVGAADSLDVLINNAGIFSMDTVEDESLERFQQVMNTNFFGAVRCIKAVAPSMRRRGAGLIVNVTSVAGKIAFFASGAYAASKFAMEAMSECLAQELAGYGVRVAVVEPGIIATPMTLANLPKTKAGSAYPHGPRVRAFFGPTQTGGPAPDVVAQTILGIVDGSIVAFRSPSGPDAIPFLQLRAAHSDEDWNALGGTLDDNAYFDRVLELSGVDFRPAKAGAQ